jgi:hypothetical protein
VGSERTSFPELNLSSPSGIVNQSPVPLAGQDSGSAGGLHVLDHGVQLFRKYGGHRPTAGMFAQRDGSSEGFQAPEAGGALRDVNFDLAASGLVHLTVEVLGQPAEKFQAM